MHNMNQLPLGHLRFNGSLSFTTIAKPSLTLTFILLLSIGLNLTSTLTLVEGHDDNTLTNLTLTKFLHSLYQATGLFGGCTLQLFWHANPLHPLQTEIKDNLNWRDKITHLLAYSHLWLNSNGVTVSSLDLEGVGVTPSPSIKRYRQPDVIAHSRRCSLVLIILILQMQNDDKHKGFTEDYEVMLRNALTRPLLLPPTLRNQDKYLILTNEQNLGRTVKTKVVRGLKFKLFLVPSTAPKDVDNCGSDIGADDDFRISFLGRSCQHGLCKEGELPLLPVNFPYHPPKTLGSLGLNLEPLNLFPDLETNYFGRTLRLSTTTKVPQLLELEIVKDKDGNVAYLPKRGLYATVLTELSARLNFTYEIVPSSGKGSTGHALPNGTWVGTVGDTYRGEVDFGFMAAITHERFRYAEFCAPINFAYMGFVSGPPRKDYSWVAILWPFEPMVWAILGLTIILASKVPSVMTRYSPLASSCKLEAEGPNIYHPPPFYPAWNWKRLLRSLWNYLKDMVFLIRSLLEQCDQLPSTLLTLSISYRLFLTIWLLFCLVISTAYRSKMVSLLTFPIFDRIPTTFDELAMAPDFQIDFHYFGNVGYAYFQSSTNPSFMKIFRRMGKEPDALKCLQRTLSEKAACITFIATFEELLYRNLSDQYGKSPLKFTPHRGALFPAGVIHQHKAPLSVNFQGVLFPAMETGLIFKWQQEDLDQVLQNKNKWGKANNVDVNVVVWGNDMNSSNDNLLRVRNLSGALVIFGVGMVASVLAFLGERKMKGYSHAVHRAS